MNLNQLTEALLQAVEEAGKAVKLPSRVVVLDLANPEIDGPQPVERVIEFITWKSNDNQIDATIQIYLKTEHL